MASVRLALAFIAALWVWKIAEYAARETGLLERSLGWGFSVNFTVPVIATIAFLLILAIRQLIRILLRRSAHRFV